MRGNERKEGEEATFGEDGRTVRTYVLVHRDRHIVVQTKWFTPYSYNVRCYHRT